MPFNVPLDSRVLCPRCEAECHGDCDESRKDRGWDPYRSARARVPAAQSPGGGQTGVPSYHPPDPPPDSLRCMLCDAFMCDCLERQPRERHRLDWSGRDA